ncbi:hypothetical protein [Streptomyces sp. ME19-01-6]|uniref:hypothetical protein n=1 Tax=Streptomyces sp. ME19-01-6 TaxID=3028686 RepID=UPI0029B369C4|nr:hypothetical protein [Streptomyces sp. ME19-01-6]MDX3231261.1 hypothetical protein [Streptomyces sp. ME19-01-6]
MSSLEGGAFDGWEIDPDAVMWVRGVDYIAGWRDATAASGELDSALRLVGVDMEGARLRAATAADGSGVVRFELSAAVAREVAALAREAAAQCRKAG